MRDIIRGGQGREPEALEADAKGFTWAVTLFVVAMLLAWAVAS